MAKSEATNLWGYNLLWFEAQISPSFGAVWGSYFAMDVAVWPTKFAIIWCHLILEIRHRLGPLDPQNSLIFCHGRGHNFNSNFVIVWGRLTFEIRHHLVPFEPQNSLILCHGRGHNLSSIFSIVWGHFTLQICHRLEPFKAQNETENFAIVWGRLKQFLPNQV